MKNSYNSTAKKKQKKIPEKPTKFKKMGKRSEQTFSQR